MRFVRAKDHPADSVRNCREMTSLDRMDSSLLLSEETRTVDACSRIRSIFVDVVMVLMKGVAQRPVTTTLQLRYLEPDHVTLDSHVFDSH